MTYDMLLIASIQKRVASLVKELGVLKTAVKLGIGRESVARIVGGLGVQRGTEEIVRRRLGELEREKVCVPGDEK